MSNAFGNTDFPFFYNICIQDYFSCDKITIAVYLHVLLIREEFY